MKTYDIWFEDRQHLMNIEGKNETDARENFNDMIFVKEKNEYCSFATASSGAPICAATGDVVIPGLRLIITATASSS